MVYQTLKRSQGVRSPELQQPTTIIYLFAVIVEPVADTEKERHCLTAYFNEHPFPFEIEEWARSITGNDYRVVDSFLLDEINL